MDRFLHNSERKNLEYDLLGRASLIKSLAGAAIWAGPLFRCSMEAPSGSGPMFGFFFCCYYGLEGHLGPLCPL